MPEPDQRWAIVVAGGPGAVPADLRLPSPALVVAADSGLERATALGLRPDLVVGDFDSVAPGALAGAEAAGARVERHPREKDATDLELALRVAREAGARRVLVVAGDGGRFDHTLGNALLLASADFADLEIEAAIGPARLAVVRTEAVLTGRAGDFVSLLAVGGPARGIVTEGLRYPLCGEELQPGTSRGISNELVGERARVSVGEGVLLAVQPGPVA